MIILHYFMISVLYKRNTHNTTILIVLSFFSIISDVTIKIKSLILNKIKFILCLDYVNEVKAKFYKLTYRLFGKILIKPCFITFISSTWK